MGLRALRWLGFLGPIGLLGLIGLLPRPLWPLTIFLVFTDFWRADERNEQNLGRAAVVAFTVTLLALAATFVLLSIPHKDFVAYSGWLTGWALILIYLLNIAAFVGTYLYFELRGNRP